MLNGEICASKEKVVVFLFFFISTVLLHKALSINLFCAFYCVYAACGLTLLKKYRSVQATPLELSPYSAVISKASYQIALNYGGVTSLKGILWVMAVYKLLLEFFS